VARKGRKPVAKAQRRTAWLSVVAAYSIGAVFVAAGVLALVFGKEEPQAAEARGEGSVAQLGIGLIFIGLVAFAIVGCMHWVKKKG
jgi:hypothetical protein